MAEVPYIDELDALTSLTVDQADLVQVEDVSTGDAKKIRVDSLSPSNRVPVTAYGADPTGVSDSASAINAAAAAAGEYGIVDFVGGSYLISSTISLTSDYQTWDMTGAVITANFDGRAVDVGQSGSRLYGPTLIGGYVVRSGALAWTAGNVGVRLYNVAYPVYKDFRIHGFTAGLELYADGTQGTVYCSIYPKVISSCKYGIKIYSADTTSWVNENHFFGGEVQYNTDNPDEGYLVHIDHNSSTSLPDNNTFFGVSFELANSTPDGGAYINGTYNHFICCRFEGFGAGAIIFWGSDADYNSLYHCWGIQNMSDIDTTNEARTMVHGSQVSRMISAAGDGYPGLIVREGSSVNYQAIRVEDTSGNNRFNIDSYGNFQSFMFNGAPGSGAQVLTGTALKRGLIDEDPEGNATWTTDTAENIVAAVDSAYAGLSFRCLLHNDATAASGEIVTVAGGVGVTMHGTTLTMTEGTNTTMELIFVLTNVTASSEAVDCYVITHA